MYYRQRGDRYAVGNYRHEPILFDPDRLSRREPGEPMPSIEPFTPEDFAGLRGERRLLPALAGRIDVATAINGMFSFTPDMGSIVGESRRRPRPLGLRGGVGHPRRRHGPDGRRVDGRRASRAWTWPRPTRTASTRS